MSSSSSEYVPVQYDSPLNEGQDPTTFYGDLIDPQTGIPSQIFCRMSDSLFFHLNKNCPVNQESGYIEPEKVLWRSIVLGEKQDLKLAPVYDLGTLYLSASIPHSFNANREALLDRRGFLHLLVFEVAFDPEGAYKDWNCRFNVLQLIDPLTGLHFPTPVPRSSFPTEKNPQSSAIYEKWEQGLIARLKTQSQPQLQSQSASTSLQRQQQDFLEYQQALRQQENLVMRSQIMARHHRTRMNIIDNIGGYNYK